MQRPFLPFHDKLVVRLAALPLRSVYDTKLKIFKERQDILYTASLHLFHEQNEMKEKVFSPLVRYYTRLCTRPTPFGLFAGYGVAQWSEPIVVDTQQTRYHTRLDNLVLHRLTRRLTLIPAIQDQLRYFPNNCLYTIHDEMRYVEYSLTDQGRDYKLSAVKTSDSLVSVIQYCQAGARLSDIACYLAETYKVTIDEADTYVHELVTNQLLISELEPAITGEEYLPRLVRQLEEIEEAVINQKSSDLRRSWLSFGPFRSKSKVDVDNKIIVGEVLKLLRNLDQQLKQAGQHKATFPRQGAQVVKLLHPWLPDLSESKLFQVDMVFPTANTLPSISSLTSSLPQQLSKVLAALSKLTPTNPNPSLIRFSERFRARYGDQEIPLGQALDSDTGIDYLFDYPTAPSPLVENVNPSLPDEEQLITWTKLQQWRWSLLQRASFNQQTTIELTDEMLKDFVAREDDLPPSMSIMFRQVENDYLYLDSVGGVSATNLINRFAHADPNIHQIVQDICRQEQQHNPDVIFAEIVHLPESRMGNIMFHPISRAYEIPYLAVSAVDEDYQLPLSDLGVSVQNGRIILRSLRLNQEVIPRLSMAHNYQLSELAVYRFLCDLQGQSLRSYLSFSWGPLAAHQKFLPRVTYENVILHPATWQLTVDDFAELKTTSDFWSTFKVFCARWRLPQRWVLADGDNELFVDSEQPHIVDAWWDLAKKRDQLTIKEFFAPADGGVVNERGEAHAHQLVASWIKQAPTYSGWAVGTPNVDQVDRSFAPGSEWLYYKLYGGVSNADRVLEEVIASLTQQLQAERRITLWFFIRYADPDPHLRLRFRLRDVAHLGEVMHQVQQVLAPFLRSGMLHKVQLDTYQRELERYGGKAIIQAETLFHYDSEAILQFLFLTEGDEREDLRWLWGLRSIDELLNDFQLPISEKLALLQGMKESFAREFRMDKSLKLQLDKKYRTHRQAIHDMLILQDPANEFYPLVEALQDRSAHHASAVTTLLVAHQANELPLPLTDLLRSYVHMLVNRLIPSQARFHELVLYDFLYRQYRSEIAQGKKDISRKTPK